MERFPTNVQDTGELSPLHRNFLTALTQPYVRPIPWQDSYLQRPISSRIDYGSRSDCINDELYGARTENVAAGCLSFDFIYGIYIYTERVADRPSSCASFHLRGLFDQFGVDLPSAKISLDAIFVRDFLTFNFKYLCN